jgi:hypothetical protein
VHSNNSGGIRGRSATSEKYVLAQRRLHSRRVLDYVVPMTRPGFEQIHKRTRASLLGNVLRLVICNGETTLLFSLNPIWVIALPMLTEVLKESNVPILPRLDAGVRLATHTIRESAFGGIFRGQS